MEYFYSQKSKQMVDAANYHDALAAQAPHGQAVKHSTVAQAYRDLATALSRLALSVGEKE